MSLVLDSSISLAWYFDDEVSIEADEVLDRVMSEGAVVPALWYFEVANALQMSVRRNRIDGPFRDQAFAKLRALPITSDSDSANMAWQTSVQISSRHRLTVYDAAYLELAQRRNLPLATLDRALVRAAEAEHVAVLGV